MPSTLGVLALAAAALFGDKIVLKEPTSLKTALASFETYKDKDLLTTGVVEKVCEKKGCWMTVKTDATSVRVTFKDYGFFVPLDAAGKAVRLQGRLVRKEIPVADQRHLLEDAGASRAEIEAVKIPKVETEFVASAVEIGA